MKKPKNLGYYEGVLQLRNINDELITFLNDKIVRYKARIVKEVWKKNNADLYFEKKKDLKKIASLLNKKFLGITKKSYKLHTRNRQTSKMVYRDYILFKPLNIKVNSRIIFKGKEYFVVKIVDNKKLILKDVSGRKEELNINKIAKERLIIK